MNIEWLKKIEGYLAENKGEDLFYLISTMLFENRKDFIHFLMDASNGIGTVVHEGLECVLDSNLDGLSEVTFYVGEIESSSISFDEFVVLMSIISNAYIVEFPDETNDILHYMNLLANKQSVG